MLPRVSLRAVPKPATIPRRACTSQWIRGYAKHRAPPKPSAFRSPSDPPSKPSVSPQNQTWKPSDGIKFGAGSATSSNTQQASSEAAYTGKLNTQAPLERSTVPNSQLGPGISESATSAAEQANSSDAQGDFSTSASPYANNAQSSSPIGSAKARQQPQKPSQPLPDLRFGIPSTFDAEFGGKAAPSATEKSSPQKDDFNVADESTEPASSGSGRGGREDELPKSAYETSIDRRRNKWANIMYAGFAVVGVLGAVYSGRNWDTEEEEKAHPEAPPGWGLGLFYDRIKARVSGRMGYYTEPTFPKLLPDMDPAPPLTLVLSLEDLMIHSEWSREHGWRTAKRPGLDYFLRYLSQYYELVVFTSLPVAMAEPIIRKLDPFKIIMWPLFREATRYQNGEYIKDLSYLNRDLNKVVLIDTKLSHAKLQKENSIILSPWKGEPGDRNLVALIPFLEHVATMGITDVRQAIKSFEGRDIPTEFAAREARARETFTKQLAEERAKRPRRSGLGALTSALGIKPGGMMMPGEPSVTEGFEQGKMLSDQIRERGMRQYEALETEIRENGERWLKEMEAEEKKAQEEHMKSMKSGFLGVLGATPKDGGSK